MFKNKKLLFLFLIVLFLQINTNAQRSINQLQQVCPGQTTNTTRDVNYESQEAMWDILLSFETTSSTQGGVVTDTDFIYTSSFSTEMFRKFTMDGVFLEEFTIPGVASCSKLTYDGTSFYGASGSLEDGIYVLDLENHVLINTISVSAPSIIGIVHITFDPELDGGNGGFWVGYWHELAAVDMNGNEIIADLVTDMPGIAGSAYDNISDPANPGLFLFQRTGSSNLEIIRFDINTQTFSGVLHIATDIPYPSGGSSSANASGMNSFINNDGKLVLLGLIGHFPGNEMVFEYEITNAFSYVNDISVQYLLSPITGDDLTSNEDVTVRLLNNGTIAQSNFDIDYTINDGSTTQGPFTHTISETINAGEYLDVTFIDQADLSTSGNEYTIVVSSFLAGDENSANDILTKIVTNTSGVICFASGSSNSSNEYISNVSMEGVSNSSGANQYTDYTNDPSLFINLEEGIASQLNVAIANGFNANILAVWIDWNGNGDFYDTGDSVYVSPFGTGPFSTNITPPAGSLLFTNLRMRIRLDYNEPSPDPCGSTSFGEVEDYTVIVSGELGITDHELSKAVIYPNPLKNYSIINFSNPENNKYSLRIIDMHGKTVRIINNIYDNKILIEKGKLTRGMYIVELKGINLYRSKIIVN